MQLDKLLKLRKVVPATMFVLLTVPFVDDLVGILHSMWPQLTSDSLLKYAWLLVALPLGWLYDAFDIREFINCDSHQSINIFVERRMRESLTKHLSTEQINKASHFDKKWLRLLYRQVDADSTLQEIAKRIRDNGLIWTSAADAGAIMLPGGFEIAVVGLGRGSFNVFMYGCFLCAMGLLGIWLISKLENKHLMLCEEQQVHIAAYRSKQLADDFLATFS